jgi:hypothetical protein
MLLALREENCKDLKTKGVSDVIKGETGDF